jgi:hypothetical protein
LHFVCEKVDVVLVWIKLCIGELAALKNKLNKDGEKGLVDKKKMNGWGVGWAVVRYVSTVV